jgi:P4 family phage/plasmid primase-like protien
MINAMNRKHTDLNEFLAKHSAKNSPGINATHTRIPDKKLNIYGGSYVIPEEAEAEFYGLYYDHIFVNKNKEYLTEKQLENIGPLVVDFDFKYDYNVDTRQHTKDHIIDMIVLYLDELKKLFVFTENAPFPVYIFEKPNVNRVEDKSLTKDGIHMIVGLKVDHTMQTILRNKVMELLPEIWDLPLTNDYSLVLDEGISKGAINWQLFGSRKPSNEAYELSHYFSITYDAADSEFMVDELNVDAFDLRSNFQKLSVRYKDNVKFDINPKILEEYNGLLLNKKPKLKRPTSKTKIHLLIENEDDNYISLLDIKNKETLDKAVANMLTSLCYNEYEIKETHEYAQVLPEKFYGPGSHLDNRLVAFALKKTDERLFLSWVLLRSKASDFDYNTVPELYEQWKKYFNTAKDGVTRRSIMYWAKQYNLEGYQKVKDDSIDHAIDETLTSQTEYDKAQVLKQMFKDKYVCVSYDKRGAWYKFENHKWIQDKGLSLREAISKQMYDLYSRKSDRLSNEFHHYEASDDRAEFIKKKIKIIGDVMITLKRTNDKNNIMREAMELFYDADFMKNMDTNKYLLCFKNGIVDFKNKIFRDGYPEDYVTKTTRINYIPFDTVKDTDLVEYKDELITFMEKLFPVAELNRYMWDHLASCLIGSNLNQTFNVYHGSGSNGKSILTDLMSVTLGEYKGTVPITLVTEKRGLIGGTSDEVLKLKGVRYAVMQEPSKNVKLNEGIMKELTGGDPIQARGLYSESEIFEPQFNLVVCTNNLFDIESNDDGTWRRIRKCDFVSKFIDDGETHTDSTEYVYKKDKSLKDKLPKYAPLFASMLVKRAFETDGIVKDCDFIMNASNKYRKTQDHIAEFVSETIVKTDNNRDKIGKRGIAEHFKMWFTQEQGNRRPPKGQELIEFMNKKFGMCKSTGWHGCKFIAPEIDELEELDNDEC